MTDKTPPMAFTWHADMGEHGAMVARNHAAQSHFEDRQTYRMEVKQGRSQRSHNHEFVVIDEAWKNLPENQSARFPTSVHFRKFLLIKCGYCTTTDRVFDSPRDAMTFADYVEQEQEYHIAMVRGCVVTVFVAESQSVKSMGKARFQESKQAILESAAAMIGVSVEDLAKNAGRAA